MTRFCKCGCGGEVPSTNNPRGGGQREWIPGHRTKEIIAAYAKARYHRLNPGAEYRKRRIERKQRRRLIEGYRWISRAIEVSRGLMRGA